LHGNLDTLLPIRTDSDVYTKLVRQAGRGDMHRYYVIGRGNHVDSFYDDNKERLRPILPCHRDAFSALEDFVERDVAPPSSGYVPKPKNGDVVNECSLEEKAPRPDPQPADPDDPGSGPGPACTITGTRGSDELRGTRRDDVICGLGGGYTIEGLGGDDTIRGDAGGDVLSGGEGKDTVIGGSEGDGLEGGKGADRLLSLAVGHAAMYGPQAAFFSELFGTRVRYSGASLGYQLASIFAGALSPIVAAALFAATGSYVPVALLLAGMAVVTIVAVLVATETHMDDIEADRGAEQQLIAESASSGGSSQPRAQ